MESTRSNQIPGGARPAVRPQSWQQADCRCAAADASLVRPGRGGWQRGDAHRSAPPGGPRSALRKTGGRGVGVTASAGLLGGSIAARARLKPLLQPVAQGALAVLQLRQGAALCLLLTCWMTMPAAEQPDGDSPPGPGEPETMAAPGPRKQLSLSLEQAILLAVQKNLDVRIARITPEILGDGVEQARSAFDPVISGALGGGKSRTQNATQLAGAAVSDSDVLNTGVSSRRRLGSGAVVQADAEAARQGTNSFFSSFESISSGNVGVSVLQPLLRGRGLGVNLAAIRIAGNARDISIHDFKRTAERIAAASEKVYWALAFARENFRVQGLTLRQAQQLEQLVEERVRLGLLTRNDLTQAKAGVASREETVILAEQAIRDTEDALKSLTDMLSDESLWETEIVPRSRAPLTPAVVDAAQCLEQAFANRPEYLGMKLDLANRDISLVLAENAQYPQLDLSAAFSINGVTGSFGNTIDSLVSTDFYEWNVGVSLELPLGLRSARSTLKRRRAEKAQALLRFKKLEQDLLREIRIAARQVTTAQKRIRTTEVARSLQKDKLESEQERLKEGKSTAQEVLDFQVDLALAEVNYLRSVLDYRKSLVDLELAKGTLLESRSFEVTGNVITSLRSDGP